jgi:hypothetical protein
MSKQKENEEMGAPMAMAVVSPQSVSKKAWLQELVTFEFLNIECPGVLLPFTYGSTKNPKKYRLFHGAIYTLPREIKIHIETRQTPIWDWMPDGTGKMHKKYMGSNNRFICREVFNYQMVA